MGNLSSIYMAQSGGDFIWVASLWYTINIMTTKISRNQAQ